MASCNASDVQVKAFSPPYRRAREARKGSVDELYCEAEEKGMARCPDGYCRCTGELRKKVETRDHPWGSPHQDAPVHAPPAMTEAELQAAAAVAAKKRGAARPAMIASLEKLIADGKGAAPGMDEEERLRELEEWLAVLRAEQPRKP